MRRLHRGDKVTRRNETYVGVITNLRERGVAGSAVTYLEWVEVTYDNGTVVKGDPAYFTKVEDG